MKLIFQVQTLVDKIRESYNPANCSYKVIDSDFDDKYLLSLEFLNNATMNLLAAKNYYENHEDLERHDFEDYFKAFSDYKFELFQVIEEKDQNTSWLSSRKDTLDSAKRDIEDLLKTMNLEYEEVQKRNRENAIKPEDIKGLFKAPKYV